MAVSSGFYVLTIKPQDMTCAPWLLEHLPFFISCTKPYKHTMFPAV